MADQTQEMEPPGIPTASSRGRILVVDDNVEIGRLLGDYFLPHGFEVVSVGDADAAFGMLDEEPPDLVLLDIDLPGISGLEALRQIREQHPSIGVIIITGYQDPRLAQATLQLGALNYLVKPFDMERLDQVVHWNIRRARSAERDGPAGLAVSQAGDVTVVVPDADLDMDTARQLSRALTDLVEAGSGARLVIDLDAVSYVDSSGLGVLVSVAKAARAAGGDLKLCHLREHVRSVLDLTGLTRHLSLYADPQTAVAAFD